MTLTAARSTTAAPPRGGRPWVGIALIAAAGALGWLLLGADHRQQAWSAARSLPVGTQLSAADVVATPVDVPGESGVWIGREPPTGIVRTPVPAGALLTLAAVESGSDSVARPAVTLAVPAQEVPLGLAAGEDVDVWAVRDGEVEQLLDHVSVIDTNSGDGIDPTASVAIGIDPQEEEAAVRALAAEEVLLVRHAGSPDGSP